MYLGYVITRDGIRPDYDKVKVLSELGFPKTPEELTRFLGAVNFY